MRILKPLPHRPPHPNRRLPRKDMTLVAGFRCKNGVVICADTQHTGTYIKFVAPKLWTDRNRVIVAGACTDVMYLKMAVDEDQRPPCLDDYPSKRGGFVVLLRLPVGAAKEHSDVVRCGPANRQLVRKETDRSIFSSVLSTSHSFVISLVFSRSSEDRGIGFFRRNFRSSSGRSVWIPACSSQKIL